MVDDISMYIGPALPVDGRLVWRVLRCPSCNEGVGIEPNVEAVVAGDADNIVHASVHHIVAGKVKDRSDSRALSAISSTRPPWLRCPHDGHSHLAPFACKKRYRSEVLTGVAAIEGS
jgi:hypothetical protein